MFKSNPQHLLLTTLLYKGWTQAAYISSSNRSWKSGQCQPINKVTNGRHPLLKGIEIGNKTRTITQIDIQLLARRDYNRVTTSEKKVITMPSDTRWEASGFSVTEKFQSVLKCFMGLYDWQCASCQQLFFSLPTIDGAESWSWPCYASSATDLLLSLHWQ